MDEKYTLIEMSEDEESVVIDYYLKKFAPIYEDENNSSSSDDESDSEYIEIVIKKDNSIDYDSRIKDFVDFCIKKNLYEDCTYESNILSKITTQLPDTFKLISGNKKDIKKTRFLNVMKNKYKYKGDINFIYNNLDKEEKGYVTWEDFRSLFFPFII